jgi:predicted ABC-type transport system involved in lysophospholipase L1 biosynthesis ATPase subunit
VPGEPLIQLRVVRKDYQSLRPLRVEHLDVHEGESVALLGFDAAMAEVLVNLITGASVPDSGQVIVFGQSTGDIADMQGWLKTLDQFGLVSERAVLVDQLTTEQSLAMPLSLDFHDMPAQVRDQTRRLAAEIGLTTADLAGRTGDLSPDARYRLRLGRALALNPRVLLAEHPNASLTPDEIPRFAADLSRIVASRGIAAVTITADRTFAAAVSERLLTLHPATGVLKPSAGWRRWF